MCGIAGILDFNNREVPHSVIQRMTDAVAHRGPDADGFFAAAGISFGHRRLSIIDISAASNQPFRDNSGRFIIIFNGEIYNYKEVKAQIRDYDFHTSGDTEMLVAAYAKWGPDCIKFLRGMFAFAIWDTLQNELFIVRDPLGVKPLYYYVDNEKFLFSSEVRSILASGQVERKVSTKALLEYFSYQSVGYPHAIIDGVEQLEAGSWIKVRDGKIEKNKYWDVTTPRRDWEVTDSGKVHEHIRNLLRQSVERRLVSDVPVGAFLSGGIDSASIVGLMAETGKASPNTFNIAFEEKDYDESKYADLIARKFKTNHTRILLKPTIFLDELQNALDAMDTPSGDGINTYVVSKAVRQQGMTVALSGIGGDELFAGYPLFSQFMQLQQRSWVWKMPVLMRELIAYTLLPGSTDNKTNRIQQMIRRDSCSIENMYPVLRQIFSPKQIHRFTNFREGQSFITSLQKRLIERKENIHRLPCLSQVSVAEYLGYTQHTLLKDTDQMSMAVSLEAREPFFDQDLVEYVISLPDVLKKPAYPKSLLVESIKPMLPDEIVFRKKQGFLFPWKVWLKNDLRSFCEMHLKNIAKRPFIHGDQLLTNWQKFLNGNENVRWSEIWLFVVLEYWLVRNNVE